MRTGRRLTRANVVVVGLFALVLIAAALAVAHPGSGCPGDWDGASRIELPGGSADVSLDGKGYRVGGSALLDYGPGGDLGHPLTVVASISASSRDALGTPEFTCFRAIRGTQIWAGRATTHGVQTMADGYPPGAKSPVPNEAWRMATIRDGPQWPDGDPVSLELWVDVNGRHYIFVVPPFALMRGG